MTDRLDCTAQNRSAEQSARWEADTAAGRKTGFGGGEGAVIKTRKGMTSVYVDRFNIDKQVNIVSGKLEESDRLSDDLWWLLLTVVEHTCSSGHTLSATVYPLQLTVIHLHATDSF